MFPPAAPKSLAAVSSAGAISLIWEGTEEPDLAGYIVLRGTAPGTPVDRLTPQPIRETTFRDTAVKPGTRVRVRGCGGGYGDATKYERAIEPDRGDRALMCTGRVHPQLAGARA